MSSNLRNKYEILNYLTEKNYTCLEPLGIGGYGDVFAAISPQQSSVALKVIPNNKSWKYEERIWPSLHHHNILPLIEIMHVKHLQCKIYVTPRHPCTLNQVLDIQEFKKEKDALRTIKKWFTDILSALNYLHSSNYCHLDIKTNNVLISMDDDAVVCDFSGLNTAGKRLKRFVAPMRCRPPEYFGLTTKVEGIRFDMWTYGLLVLNVLTHFNAMERMRLFHRSWGKKECLNELTSWLKEVLQEIYFYDEFDKTFEHIWVSEVDKVYALDFVRFLLKFDPKERPTAAQAMQHPFLKEGVEDYDDHFRDSYGFEDDSDEVLSGEQEVFFDAPDETSSEEAEAKEVRENLIVPYATEQDANADRHNPSDISQDIRGENLSNDDMASVCHPESKECCSMHEENSKRKKMFSQKKLSLKSAKNWFEKKINKVFKKKEIHYQKLIEDND